MNVIYYNAIKTVYKIKYNDVIKKDKSYILRDIIS